MPLGPPSGRFAHPLANSALKTQAKLSPYERGNMDYIVYDAPEKCLRSAASYLLDRGYSIENRTEDSLTLSRNPEIGGGLVFWGCLATLFTAGGAILFRPHHKIPGVWRELQ